MKKVYIMAIGIITGLVLLTGCSSGNDATTEEISKQEIETVEDQAETKKPVEAEKNICSVRF